MTRLDELYALAAGALGDECVLWTFAKDSDGYGHVWAAGKVRKTHTLVCRTYHGERPPGHEVAHSCAVRACVNPRHLRWATHAENIAERDEHGRTARGERHGHARLRERDVRTIRALVAAGWTYRKVAAAFGIANSQVSRIVNGQTWAHLE